MCILEVAASTKPAMRHISSTSLSPTDRTHRVAQVGQRPTWPQKLQDHRGAPLDLRRPSDADSPAGAGCAAIFSSAAPRAHPDSCGRHTPMFQIRRELRALVWQCPTHFNTRALQGFGLDGAGRDRMRRENATGCGGRVMVACMSARLEGGPDLTSDARGTALNIAPLAALRAAPRGNGTKVLAAARALRDGRRKNRCRRRIPPSLDSPKPLQKTPALPDQGVRPPSPQPCSSASQRGACRDGRVELFSDLIALQHSGGNVSGKKAFNSSHSRPMENPL